MNWLELSVITTAAHAEELGDSFMSLGAQAITEHAAGEETIYEPAPNETPLWENIKLIALFDAEHPLTEIENFLIQQAQQGVLHTVNWKPITDQAWERVCLQDFKPLYFGEHLCICPSWDIPPDPTKINVILDPGLAFGTGTSPTTALCLEWLDANIKPGMTVIDYGCGSGILALAALKLGAKKAFAIDYDPQAIIATKENGLRNQLEHPVLQTFLPHEFVAPPSVDLVIANILAKSLIELAPVLTGQLQSGGKLLLSGILISQADDVMLAYKEWFTFQAPTINQEWVRLVGTKN